jgi:type 2 lantibiotic biosynthesis protein LanM
MYALGATDLHAENLIAQGSQPLLVDVETLFQPRLDSSRNDTADAVTRKLLDDSIWSTGLLPDPALEDALDVSGLGASTAQLAPVAVPVVSTEAGNLRVDRMQPVLDSFKNRAVLNGVATVPSDWAEAVESGFSRTYRLLQSIGTQLPLQPFHQDPIRVLVRSTVRYGLTLMESWHPNLLRHGLAREQYFDHLWSDVQDHPWLARCIGSELAQMLNADIPHFTSTPLSLDIHGADGTHIAHLTVETGMQVAQGRIHRMGTDDLEFQLLLLRKSLYARQLPHSEAGDTAASAPDPLVLARQVGDALVSTALRCDGTSTWVTAEAGTFEPAGTGLYDGLPGIILFLAYLDTIVPDSKAPYRLLAEEALVQLQQLPAPTAPGAFTGLSGHIYLWIHLATLWSRPDLLQRAADAVPSLHVGDAPLDVIDGSAGIIACLLALHHVEPASGGLARATALGEHALQQAVACETGLKWPTLPRQRGFSHGSSGLAWSLARLGKVTHDQRFLEAAEDAFRYEEALVEASGWFDAEERTDAGSWCHGPPGIALARLGAHQEAQSALAITTESAALRHPGLCHGELGNLETLIVASPARENRVQALLRRTDLADTRRDPGLMTGLSGIGYGLLRLHAPHRVPSVLSLESPAH